MPSTTNDVGRETLYIAVIIVLLIVAVLATIGCVYNMFSQRFRRWVIGIMHEEGGRDGRRRYYGHPGGDAQPGRSWDLPISYPLDSVEVDAESPQDQRAAMTSALPYGKGYDRYGSYSRNNAPHTSRSFSATRGHRRMRNSAAQSYSGKHEVQIR